MEDDEKQKPKKIDVSDGVNTDDDIVEADQKPDDTVEVIEADEPDEKGLPEEPVAAEETPTVEGQAEGTPEPESTDIEADGASDQSLDKATTVGEAMDNAEDESAVDVFERDPEIDKAVDDIVRSESDESIAETDAKLAVLAAVKNKRTLRSRLAGFFAAWWGNLPARYGTLAGMAILVTCLILLPTTRYGVLNLFGARVGSSLVVIDSQTRLPLKNIDVTLQGKAGVTDADGKVSFVDLRLGKSELSITKRGYADSRKDIVLGWGSNPLGDIELQATGEQFTFVLSDWQSGAAVNKAEASAGTNSARSDDNGKIVLTIGEEDMSAVTVTISAEGYRDEKITNDQLTSGDMSIKMVPSRKHVFVSNRNGEYDLYKIDVDKKNEEVLLSATGKEREVPRIVAHPSRDIVAFVSSRDGETNGDGYVLDGLYIIDVISGETKRIARSEQLQIIGWSGDRLVYWQVVEGTSRANPERSKLISYNERTSERIDLAAANYFNDVKLVGSTVYYAVSSYAVPQSQAKLYRIDTSGQDMVKLLDKQVWGIYRAEHDKLLFSADDQKWYQRIDDGLIEEVDQQISPQNISFIDGHEGEATAWVEVRDGKGVLLISQDGGDEQSVLTLPGLSRVLYWVNDTSVVFRIISNSETADYIVDTVKGEALKITDVSATNNFYF